MITPIQPRFLGTFTANYPASRPPSDPIKEDAQMEQWAAGLNDAANPITITVTHNADGSMNVEGRLSVGNDPSVNMTVPNNWSVGQAYPVIRQQVETTFGVQSSFQIEA